MNGAFHEYVGLYIFMNMGTEPDKLSVFNVAMMP